jgi:hypothetical protein
MGNCRICGKDRELRDIHGGTSHSTVMSNKFMDRWRKKQESLKKDD